MNTGLLHVHTLLRYFILLALVLVIVKALMGWLGKKPYTKLDDKMGLYLFIFTHMQLLVGLILYFVSGKVRFDENTMKDDVLRYWAVEHISIMLISIVLITMARITSKKMTNDEAKHRRMFIFNTLALLLIVMAIAMSGRGIIIPNN